MLKEEKAALYWRLRDAGPKDPDLLRARAALFPDSIPARPRPKCTVPTPYVTR